MIPRMQGRLRSNTILKACFQAIEAVTDYLEACQQIGKKPQKPFSGKLMFRVPPEVHAAVSIAAKASGKSLNQWAIEVLNNAAHT